MTSTWGHLLIALPIILSLTLTPAAGYLEGIETRWSAFEYPNPTSANQEQQRMCGRFNQSYVCDPNAVITLTQANDIDAEIKRVMRETPCTCIGCTGSSSDRGYKIRVAIMSSMVRVRQPDDPNDKMAQLRDARLYAYILSQRWRYEGDCMDAVLILYSREDRLVYTLTFPKAKLRLADSDVTQITMLTRPYFDNIETIADGIIQMIRRFSLCFRGKITEALDTEEVQ